MKTKLLLLFSILCCCCPLIAQDWPQWALNPQHTGQVAFPAQKLSRNLVNVIYDPLVPDEIAAVNAEFGAPDLLAHYQAPLVDDDDVYMMYKSGSYTPGAYSTQNWGETKYHWTGDNHLTVVWQFATDWNAPGNQDDFWEPVFHPALANGYLYVPGKGGSIFKVNKATGHGTRINPFSNLNSRTYTSSPLTVDASGNLYYTVIRLGGGPDFYSQDIDDSWLVKVSPSDNTQKVSYSQLTVGAPAGSDQCANAFSTEPLPWPPSPTAVAPTAPCGTQRPGVNVAPAIAPDGTIYTVTRGHLLSRETFLVATRPNLTQKWIASLRNRFHDGCGVPVSAGGSLPANGQPGGCRAGANLGVDPATNTFGGGRVLDDSSASPVVAPDGSVYFGAYTRYNYAQGHLMHFSAGGTYLGAYNFGWDVTPGIYAHGATYSLVTKDNHYGETGSYCNDDVACPLDRDATNPAYPEAYFVTQLNPSLSTIEWHYQNTNPSSCTRDATGHITCVDDHP
ncbi:MAG: hypothetical protein JWN02_2258, partial [Acidobacteria bacterium]|nr:hypothetical protein [Acidobacteriota bacterium]